MHVRRQALRISLEDFEPLGEISLHRCLDAAEGTNALVAGRVRKALPQA